jgi:beta-lactamase class A
MIMMSRRGLLTGSLLALSALSTGPVAAGDQRTELQQKLADLERRHGGRLGVAILDTAASRPIAYRGDELFPLCSTVKFLAAAFVLARVDRKQESLDRRITYAKHDLVAHSPVTEKHVEAGLTLGEICEAALTLSDNTAGNLMLASFGGPAGLTAYARSLGDRATRLDRWETALNEATPGDPRDTTTPLAMLGNLRATVLGDALSSRSRDQLAAWLMANKTGGRRLRAGVPQSWRGGDKTGTGERNTTNDIAVLWPPNRAPLIVTAYYTGAQASADERNAVLAEIGRLAASA